MSITIACNIDGISKARRPRYQQLTKLLRSAVLERSELPSGYRFRIDAGTLTLLGAARWIALERLCCPFLTFHLEARGDARDFFLSLEGPAGIKTFLDAELALGPESSDPRSSN